MPYLLPIAQCTLTIFSFVCKLGLALVRPEGGPEAVPGADLPAAAPPGRGEGIDHEADLPREAGKRNVLFFFVKVVGIVHWV